MAIYHFSVKAVSRSGGRSATASAAYRAGCRIEDSRTGLVHDYAHRGGVDSAHVVLPGGSGEWALNRSVLWNAAELAEKRKDACVAREFVVALPAELSASERQRLVLDFAKEMADREGCAVDVAIHAPGKEGDQRNHHAHMLRTTRKIEATGLGPKLDTEKAGRKRSADLEAVRSRWAELVNERLRENGLEARVDHRSLEAQGVERTPSEHLGPAAVGFERRTGRGSRKRGRLQSEAQERGETRAQIEQDLAPQVQAAAHAVIAVSDQLAKVRREREKQRDDFYRLEALTDPQLIEGMTAQQLAQHIEALRPLPASAVAAQDAQVQAAERERRALQAQHDASEAQHRDAEREAELWRQQHPVRAKAHDLGLVRSGHLLKQEALRVQAEARMAALEPRIEQAEQHAERVADAKQEEVEATQKPLRLKLQALEKVRVEKVEREQAAQRQEWDRRDVERRFLSFATQRAAKAPGWADEGWVWKDLPKPLKDMIQGFNERPGEQSKQGLAKYLKESQNVEFLDKLMTGERQRSRSRSRSR